MTIATLSAVAATLTSYGGGGEGGVSGPVLPGVPAPVPVPPVTGPTIVKLSDYPALNVVGGVAKVLNTPPVAVA